RRRAVSEVLGSRSAFETWVPATRRKSHPCGSSSAVPGPTTVGGSRCPKTHSSSTLPGLVASHPSASRGDSRVACCACWENWCLTPIFSRGGNWCLTPFFWRCRVSRTLRECRYDRRRQSREASPVGFRSSSFRGGSVGRAIGRRATRGGSLAGHVALPESIANTALRWEQ